MRPIVVATLLVLLAATFATAADAPHSTGNVFIAIADLETGRALIPEGTVVPSGVSFYVHQLGAAEIETSESSDLPLGQGLVFAYAPEARFAAARRTVATHRAGVNLERGTYFFAPSDLIPQRTKPRDFTIETQDTPTWYYLYFDDGSYLAALRHRSDSSGFPMWGVSTKLYSAPSGYGRATLRPSQSSNLVWGPTGGPYFDPYGKSKSCTVYESGGSCQTDLPYVQTSSAVVDSKGTITQRYGSCINPDPAYTCIVSYSGTIRTTVPW